MTPSDQIPEGELPQSIACETLTIMGLPVVVHVLDDGRRIFEAESVKGLLDVIANSETVAAEDVEDIRRALRGAQ